MPSEKGRRKLFDLSLKQVKVEEKLDWEYLIKQSEGYSGADITNVCREAALMPFRRCLMEHSNIEDIASRQTLADVPITMADFTQALKNISKAVSHEYLLRYEKWMKEFATV